MESTVGQLLVQEHLPDDLKHFANKPLDKKGIGELFTALTKRPEIYNDVASNMARLGFELSTVEGSSVSLDDLKSPIDKNKRFRDVEKEVEEIKKKKLPKFEERNQIVDKYQNMVSKLDKDVLEAGIEKGISLAKTIRAGSRGSSGQYRATVAAPGLVVDANSEPIYEVPVEHSFAEGLSLPEYLASSFSARQSEVAKKLSTASSGYYCLSGDTKVRMADYSTKEISKIQVGDVVLGANYEGKTFPTTVLNVFNNGVKEINEYVFRFGKSRKATLILKATKEHEVLACRRNGQKHTWVTTAKKLPLSKAHPGFHIKPAKDRLDAPSRSSFNWLKIMIGYLIGDGGLTGRSINLSTSDLDLVEVFNKNLLEHNLFIKKTHAREQDYEYILSEIVRTGRSRDEKGHPIKGLFEMPFKQELNDLELLGKYSYQKTIPCIVNSWSNNDIADLLAGLFEADGCVSHSNNSDVPIINFSVTSPDLVTQVENLLRIRFGIYGMLKNHRNVKEIGISHTVVRGKILKIKANHPVYTLLINDKDSIIRFSNHIKMPGIKGKKLEKKLKEMVVKKYDGFNYNFISRNAITPEEVFDIEVAHEDHMYVLENGMIVSNSKQLSRATITEQIEEHDCETNNGMPVPVSDKDSIGSFLAHPIEGYKKNTEIKPEVLADLTNKKITEIVVRSPITCESSRHFHPGALCQLCVGLRERGLPELKSFVGVIASASQSEPLTQSVLGSKHTQQTIGANKQLSSGFELINQLANIPKNFPGEAAMSSVDGKVTDIKPISTGGTNIYVNEKEHYAEPGMKILVKKGDEVEQGDLLSEGITNPSDIVKYKGIGEGRRAYVDNMFNAFKSSGIPVNRRNFELTAKAAIDHVQITDPEGLGDYLPDQIVSYQNLAKDYVPPKNAVSTRIDKAHGKYIQEPVLHYTIGTRVTKPVQKYLNQHKIESVLVTDHPPGFHPVMQRILDIPAHQDDFFGQMYSTYLQDRLENSVNTGIGASSDLRGSHPILGIAYGKGFGDTLKPSPRK